MFRLFIGALALFFACGPDIASADSGCLSRAEVRRLVGEKLDGAEEQSWNADLLLKAETYAVSERMSRNGVKVLKRTRRASVGPGLEVPNHSKVVTVPATDKCAELNVARPMSPEEVQQLELGANVDELADFLDIYSFGLLGLGAALDNEVRPGGFSGASAEVAGIKTPDGPHGGIACINARRITDQHDYSDTLAMGMPRPGALPSATVFLLGPACLAQAGAATLRNFQAPDDAAVARQSAAELGAAAAAVKDFGTETVNGVPNRKVGQVDMSFSQVTEDGRTATINSLFVWIDPRHLVRTKMRMEGVLEGQSESQEFFLEQEFSDYRTVPGTTLYEPYREVLRMGGMLTPAQQAEMAEAKTKLDDLDRQLASMPAGQRAMMEKMMGSQIAQMRSLVSGGAVEIEAIVTDIIVNPDFSASPSVLTGGGLLQSADSQSSLIRIIQQHLVSLGYDPGNTHGELSRPTVVAISQFQSANGLEVTGQPSPQLAGILAAAVDARN